jgi:flagellin
MAISILSNTQSVASQRHLGKSQRALNSSLGRLASGMRIVRAADDAAGLAISESLRSQVRSLGVARRNAADGISMAQTAEGALNETHGLLMRMRELSVQAANGTLSADQRGMLNDEFGELRKEIDRISEVTKFNGIQLLSADESRDLQVGIGTDPNNQIQLSSHAASSNSLATGLSAAAIDTAAGALTAMGHIDTAIDEVSEIRASFGVVQNRLEVTMDQLHTAEENLGAAESRIRDADIASETSAMTRNQILMQAGVSMLAQANSMPGIAMSLIG